MLRFKIPVIITVVVVVTDNGADRQIIYDLNWLVFVKCSSIYYSCRAVEEYRDLEIPQVH